MKRFAWALLLLPLLPLLADEIVLKGGRTIRDCVILPVQEEGKVTVMTAGAKESFAVEEVVDKKEESPQVKALRLQNFQFRNDALALQAELTALKRAGPPPAPGGDEAQIRVLGEVLKRLERIETRLEGRAPKKDPPESPGKVEVISSAVRFDDQIFFRLVGEVQNQTERPVQGVMVYACFYVDVPKPATGVVNPAGAPEAKEARLVDVRTTLVHVGKPLAPQESWPFEFHLDGRSLGLSGDPKERTPTPRYRLVVDFE